MPDSWTWIVSGTDFDSNPMRGWSVHMAIQGFRCTIHSIRFPSCPRLGQVSGWPQSGHSQRLTRRQLSLLPEANAPNPLGMTVSAICP